MFNLETIEAFCQMSNVDCAVVIIMIGILVAKRA